MSAEPFPVAAQPAPVTVEPSPVSGGRDQRGIRRELQVAVLLCLLGGALALFAAGRNWLTGTLSVPAPLPARGFALNAAALQVPVRDLALLGLAGVPALLATRRLGRVLVGGVLLVAGVAVGVLAIRVIADPAGAARAAGQRVGDSGHPIGAVLGPVTVAGWPALTAFAGLLLASAGALAALRGRRWAALSARYDAPAARQPRQGPAGEPSVPPSSSAVPPVPVGEIAAWDALDRGEDPTRG